MKSLLFRATLLGFYIFILSGCGQGNGFGVRSEGGSGAHLAASSDDGTFSTSGADQQMMNDASLQILSLLGQLGVSSATVESIRQNLATVLKNPSAAGVDQVADQIKTVVKPILDSLPQQAKDAFKNGLNQIIDSVKNSNSPQAQTIVDILTKVRDSI